MNLSLEARKVDTFRSLLALVHLLALTLKPFFRFHAL